MQAVKECYRDALLEKTFSLMIDGRSEGVELKVPSESTWDVIPHVSPAKVYKGPALQSIYIRLIDNFVLRLTWLLFSTINLEEPFHRS